MRNYFFITLVLLVFISCSTPRHSEKVLVEMELSRSKAIAQHDSAVLKNIYADDFTGLAAGGLVVNKNILMEVFRRHTNDLIFTNDDHHVRFVDKKTAVLTGRLTSKDFNHKVLGVSRYSHVLSYRDGRWQIVYGQGTVIPNSN